MTRKGGRGEGDRGAVLTLVHERKKKKAFLPSAIILPVPEGANAVVEGREGRKKLTTSSLANGEREKSGVEADLELRHH